MVCDPLGLFLVSCNRNVVRWFCCLQVTYECDGQNFYELISRFFAALPVLRLAKVFLHERNRDMKMLSSCLRFLDLEQCYYSSYPTSMVVRS